MHPNLQQLVLGQKLQLQEDPLGHLRLIGKLHQ
jgi:hypothetical protein